MKTVLNGMWLEDFGGSFSTSKEDQRGRGVGGMEGKAGGFC